MKVTTLGIMDFLIIVERLSSAIGARENSHMRLEIALNRFSGRSSTSFAAIVALFFCSLTAR